MGDNTCCCIIGWCIVLFFVVPSVILSVIFGLRSINDDAAYKEFDTSAVATDAKPCSTIGKELLQKGGSVVDAGIGAMLCVGLYNAHSAGIGGGSFMTIYDASTGNAVFINSRVVAPKKASLDLLKTVKKKKEWTGATSIAVPGEIAGYWEAHKRYGKLRWSEIFQPTIELAKKGYKVNYALGKAIKAEGGAIRKTGNNLKSIFVNKIGTLKKEGDIVKNSILARTLERIANDGASAFYKGTLAQDIVQDLEDAPGALPEFKITGADLTEYKVEVKPLINITLGHLMLLAPGAPSGGPVLCYIFNILKGYKFNPTNMEGTDAKVLTYHRIAEAFKFAYTRKREIGDERFDRSVTKVVNELLDANLGERTRLAISDSTTLNSYGPPVEPDEDMGTSHLSIVGPDGSAIAITSTINSYFGSYVRGSRTGIIFNNEMKEFGTQGANAIKPQKRPRSTMSPMIIIDPKEPSATRVRIVGGAAGGGRIVSGTALVLMNMLWFGKSVEEAVDMKRIHVVLEKPPVTNYEDGFDTKVLNGLKGKSQSMKHFPNNNTMSSVVQVVKRLDSGILGAMSDKRKRGSPDGY